MQIMTCEGDGGKGKAVSETAVLEGGRKGFFTTCTVPADDDEDEEAGGLIVVVELPGILEFSFGCDGNPAVAAVVAGVSKRGFGGNA